jgi:hypothetical protein
MRGAFKPHWNSLNLFRRRQVKSFFLSFSDFGQRNPRNVVPVGNVRRINNLPRFRAAVRDPTVGIIRPHTAMH